VSINDIVVTVFRFLRAQLRLVYHLASENPLIHGSRIKLEQVLVNNITNATDAMRQSDTKVLTVTTRVMDSAVDIAIQDTGVGIPAEILPNIFDPFFTTKAMGDGTGLGLSIAYGIVKEHHGDITVHSHTGRGTGFRIMLPIATSNSADPNPPLSPQSCQTMENDRPGYGHSVSPS
jgi:two-component system, NtrC family, sensor kinase